MDMPTGFGPEGARRETMAAHDDDEKANSEDELPCGERDYI
jgi:hypothetical protein